MATTAKPPQQTDEPAIRFDDDPDSPYYLPPIRWLTPEEGHALFDEEARQAVGMSGEEFIRRYEAGEFDEAINGPEHTTLIGLIMLIPFARQIDG